MLAGARRGRPGPAGRLRDPDAPSASGVSSGEVELRLALARGSLGIELARPTRLGPLELSELQVRLTSVRFPVDLSGGVRRFRHVRGTLAKAKLELPLLAGSKAFEPKLRALFQAAELTLAAARDGIVVGLATDGGALAFDVIAAPLEQHMRLIVEAARGTGLPDAPHTLACRTLRALLGDLAEQTGSSFLLRDPFAALCRRVLPSAGARVPATRAIRVAFSLLDDGRSGRIALTAESDEAPPALSPRVVRALETAELCADADAAAAAGDREAARRLYLSAIERAPRHPEASFRLAALDLSTGDRAEAALATLVEVASATDAGLLGCEILTLVGEPDAAYVAAAQAASTEPFGRLAAHAWLRAAALSLERSAKVSALDAALARAPALAEARWARIELALGQGDTRVALGDVEHLEAGAAGRDEKHTVNQRAAELFLARGLAAEAERLFERSLRWEPRSAASVAGLARSLRERGKVGRALDLFARAAAMAEAEQSEARHDIQLELAEALAAYANDRSSAVARAAQIPQDALAAPRARLFEARWRMELGDRTGASRALARLRSIAEMVAEKSSGRVLAKGIVDALLEASRFEEQTLSDVAAARQALQLALRLSPAHAHAQRALSRLLLADGEPRAMVVPEAIAPPQAEPAPQPAEPAPEQAPVFDPAELERKVEDLTAKLRADPASSTVASELASVLERLGRDLDLLALLSARMDEGTPEEQPRLHAQRRTVLLRLSESARAEGRASEAELYASMASG